MLKVSSSLAESIIQTFIASLDAGTYRSIGRLQGKPGSISIRDIIVLICSNPKRIQEYKL